MIRTVLKPISPLSSTRTHSSLCMAPSYKALSLPASSHRRLLYIGITCGMSAPYVASQLFYLLHKAPADLDITGMLFGFNPTDLSRNVPVEVRTLNSTQVFAHD